jgi:hypothetical protein
VLLLVVGTINVYPPPADGWTVVHVDKSDRGTWDPAQGKNIPIDIQADMRQLPFADRSVDRIQSWHALEHVNQAGGHQTIAEFSRILTADGVLDLRVPDLNYAHHVADVAEIANLLYGDQTIMPDADLNLHRWGYSETTLRALLAGHGFTAERIPAEHPDEIHVIARRSCN